MDKFKNFFFYISFGEEIFYSWFDGNIFYVVIKIEIVKEKLKILFLWLVFKNKWIVIIVEDRFGIIELSKIGVFFYGVKFVYVDNGVLVFKIDECFVIIGSLMLVNNNNLMVVVICKYVLEKRDMFYSLIENLVVRFG